MPVLTLDQTLLFYTLSGINSIKLNFQNTQQKYSLSFCFIECAGVYNCSTDSVHCVDPCILSYRRTTYRDMVHPFDKISQSGKIPVFCCPFAIFFTLKQRAKSAQQTLSMYLCMTKPLISSVLDQASGLHFSIQQC